MSDSLLSRQYTGLPPLEIKEAKVRMARDVPLNWSDTELLIKLRALCLKGVSKNRETFDLQCTEDSFNSLRGRYGLD